MKTGRGKIIYHDVQLEEHEMRTIYLFLNLGYDIELIPPSNNPQTKSPDFIMDGKIWEMKCPQGKGRTTIEHAFKKATKQSENIIIDLYRIKINEDATLKTINRWFNQTKRCKNLKVITKTRKILDFSK